MIASNRPSDRWTFKTLEEVAAFLDLPLRTVERWPSKAPAGLLGAPGRWSAAGCVQYAISISRHRHVFAEADGGTVKDQLALAELRLTEAKAIEKERENEVAEGKLLTRESVERWAAEVFTIFREAKVAIPDAVANLLPPDLRDFVRDELDRLERESLRQARIKVDELSSDAQSGRNETS